MANRDPIIFQAQKKGGKWQIANSKSHWANGCKVQEDKKGREQDPFVTCGTWSIKCLLRTNGSDDPESLVEVDPNCEVTVDEEVDDDECEEDWPNVGDEDDEGNSDRLIRAIRAAMAS
jgi:hypothetical protein